MIVCAVLCTVPLVQKQHISRRLYRCELHPQVILCQYLPILAYNMDLTCRSDHVEFLNFVKGTPIKTAYGRPFLFVLLCVARGAY